MGTKVLLIVAGLVLAGMTWYTIQMQSKYEAEIEQLKVTIQQKEKAAKNIEDAFHFQQEEMQYVCKSKEVREQELRDMVNCTGYDELYDALDRMLKEDNRDREAFTSRKSD